MMRIIYISGLILLTGFIWGQIYSAQLVDYDDNFGRLLFAFLISTLLFVTGIILIFKKIKLVMSNLVVSILFLGFNSPLTIFFAVTNYEAIFGTVLKT